MDFTEPAWSGIKVKNDLPATRCGIKRIEQQIRNDLYKFTSEAQNGPVCLKALMKNNSLALSLRAIEIRNFLEQCIQSEFCQIVAVTMKLKHVGRNAA